MQLWTPYNPSEWISRLAMAHQTTVFSDFTSDEPGGEKELWMPD